jgi:hypothetical protein
MQHVGIATHGTEDPVEPDRCQWVAGLCPEDALDAFERFGLTPREVIASPNG